MDSKEEKFGIPEKFSPLIHPKRHQLFAAWYRFRFTILSGVLGSSASIAPIKAPDWCLFCLLILRMRLPKETRRIAAVLMAVFCLTPIAHGGFQTIWQIG